MKGPLRVTAGGGLIYEYFSLIYLHVQIAENRRDTLFSAKFGSYKLNISTRHRSSAFGLRFDASLVSSFRSSEPTNMNDKFTSIMLENGYYT